MANIPIGQRPKETVLQIINNLWDNVPVDQQDAVKKGVHRYNLFENYFKDRSKDPSKEFSSNPIVNELIANTVGGPIRGVGTVLRGFEKASEIGKNLSVKAADFADENLGIDIDRDVVGFAGSFLPEIATGSVLKSLPKKTLSVGAAGKSFLSNKAAVFYSQDFLKNNIYVGDIKPNAPLFIPKVGDEFAAFVNQNRKKTQVRLAPEYRSDFYKYGQELIEKQGDLSGHMYLTDPAGTTFKLRRDKTITAGLKAVSLDKHSAGAVKRARMEAEQTITEKLKTVKGHHRGELDLFEKLTEGLTDSQKTKFYKRVNSDTRWPSLSTGNVKSNLIGPQGELPAKVHDYVHKYLRESGLDPRKMDFRKATLKQRTDFLDQLEPILNSIDEFIFNEMMSRRSPDLFKSLIE
jgi:hypothetical protein